MEKNRDQIHNILTRNAATTWKEKINEFMDGTIGKLQFVHFITQEFKRMEEELALQVDLWLKQRQSADIKPVWEDNLRTKALLMILLDELEHEEKISGEITNEHSGLILKKSIQATEGEI